MRAALILLVSVLVGTGCSGGSAGCGGAPPPNDLPPGHALLNPDAPEMGAEPPDSFDLGLTTTRGDVVIRVIRDWAPLGAARVYNLARHGFYDSSYFYRVLPGFAAQFGMSGRPAVDQIWHERRLPDEPRRQLNVPGTVAFAKAGPDSRTTQLFVNYGYNEGLDREDFVPIGRVVSGMSALYALHSGYGEMQPHGRGPVFRCVLSHGNEYLSRRYPQLDRIESVTVIEPSEQQR